MDGNHEATTDHASSPSRSRGWPLLRRRRFLVNRRYQLRAAALSVSVVLVLLVFLNLSIYSNSVENSAEMLRTAPEFGEYVKVQDRMLIFLIILGSLVFLVGVFLVSILETHKTAGACININRRLLEIQGGTYNTSLKLRRDDNLRELEPSFNRMCQALQDTTIEDIASLEELADGVDQSPRDVDPVRIAREIREIVMRMRYRLE